MGGISESKSEDSKETRSSRRSREATAKSGGKESKVTELSKSIRSNTKPDAKKRAKGGNAVIGAVTSGRQKKVGSIGAGKIAQKVPQTAGKPRSPGGPNIVYGNQNDFSSVNLPPVVYESGTNGCLACGADEDHANLLICEYCNAEFHTYCLVPPLRSVPDGDWFCNKCKQFLQDDSETDLDGLNAMVDALSPDFTSRFGEIVWAAGGNGFGWWPACIYDPRLTVGIARTLAKKHLGKKHLVYFFECHDAPFTVLGNAKLAHWEEGFHEEYDLGKAARSVGKNRTKMFDRALQIATLENEKPIDMRMDWNHPMTEDGNKRSAAQSGLDSVSNTAKKSKGREGQGSVVIVSDPIEELEPPCKLGNRIRSNQDENDFPTREKQDLSMAQEVAEDATEEGEIDYEEPESEGGRSPVYEEKLFDEDMEETGSKLVTEFELRKPATLIVSRRSNLQAVLESLPCVSGRANEIEPSDGPLYCKLLMKGMDGSDAQENIGFVVLSSRRTSTFCEARRQMKQDLDDDCLPAVWKFYVPKLGPVSQKQEDKIAVLDFLSGTTKHVRLGNGTSCNPLRLIIQDFSTNARHEHLPGPKDKFTRAESAPVIAERSNLIVPVLTRDF